MRRRFSYEEVARTRKKNYYEKRAALWKRSSMMTGQFYNDNKDLLYEEEVRFWRRKFFYEKGARTWKGRFYSEKEVRLWTRKFLEMEVL